MIFLFLSNSYILINKCNLNKVIGCCQSNAISIHKILFSTAGGAQTSIKVAFRCIYTAVASMML